MKPTTIWLFQRTKHHSQTIQRLIRGCAQHRKPVNFVPNTPNYDSVAEITGDAPFVFYGYSRLIQSSYQDLRLRPGIFYDPDLFRPSAYQENWGELLFNDYRFTTADELTDYWSRHPEERYFVKPNDDLKQFTGKGMAYDEFLELVKITDLAEGDTLAFCPNKTRLTLEYRVVMVGGYAIAVSSYQPNGDIPVPDSVLRYAEEASRIWQPAPIYVLDIACLDPLFGKELRIMEANCFNGSGLYNANTSEVVRQVSRYQELYLGKF